MRQLRIALAQINATVGDLQGNVAQILASVEAAKSQGADLVAFPELAIPGYPPEDLLLKPQFIEANLAALEEVAAAAENIVIVVGFVDRRDDIYNGAAICHQGQVAGVYHKVYLPNYGVFDENRYFEAGHETPVFRWGQATFGVNICEDIWHPDGPTVTQALVGGAQLIINISASPYHAGKGGFRERMLATRAADNTAIVAFCNLVGGQDELVFDGQSLLFDAQGELLARGRAFEEDLVVADLDLEAVFRRRLHDPRRRKAWLGPLGYTQGKLAEGQKLTSQGPVPSISLPDMEPREEKKWGLPRREVTALEGLEEIYRALVVGTRDYVHKNGFDTVVIALSGGIDSSLTAAIAADALGPKQVVGVRMPSRYTSDMSNDDAAQLAANLGIRLLTISIEPAFRAYLEMLAESFDGVYPERSRGAQDRPFDGVYPERSRGAQDRPFDGVYPERSRGAQDRPFGGVYPERSRGAQDRPFSGTEPGVPEENIQARIRGNTLMALSNKFGWLVLTTGNKSEMSVGYTTLYGDMAGGFAVIKDVPKTLAYELAHWRNRQSPVIPQRALTRPPTAELCPGQKDTDSLPPYEVLDPILKAYIEEDRGREEIMALGFDRDTVVRVLHMVDRSEYKRRQAPPGVKITPRAFGRDRRLPITNRFGG